MHPQNQFIDSLIADAAATTAQVTAWQNDCSEAQLTTRPSPEGWSAAECIDHLIITADRYYPLISQTLDRTAGSPTGGYRPGRFARWFIRMAGPTNEKKLKAPGAFKPTEGDAGPDALERFLAQQAELAALLDKARAANLNRPKFGSPITRLIRFTAGEALELMVRHQQRHLDQARRAIATG